MPSASSGPFFHVRILNSGACAASHFQGLRFPNITGGRQFLRRVNPAERFMATISPARCSLLQSIGNTPLLELTRIVPYGCATILAKAEFMNPGGSVKDRIARHIVERAEATGVLRRGSTILE